MKRRHTPISLGDALKGVVEQMGLQDGIDEALVVEAWAELAGPEINAVTRRVWIERGELVVQISNATWRQELHFSRSKWKERLNEKLNKDLVKEIRFR